MYYSDLCYFWASIYYSPFAAGVVTHSPARRSILYWFRNNHRAVICVSNIAIIRCRIISPGFRTFWLGSPGGIFIITIRCVPTYILTPTTIFWFIITTPTTRGAPSTTIIWSWFWWWSTPTRSVCIIRSIIICSRLIQPWFSVLRWSFRYWWSISLYRWSTTTTTTPRWRSSWWSFSSLPSFDRWLWSFT